MFRSVEIQGADGEAVQLPLLATAATPYWYKRIFRRDPFRDLAELYQAAGSPVPVTDAPDGTGDGETIDPIDPAALDHLSLIAQLAFVMSRQAAGADLARTAPGDFLLWLDGFAAAAFVEAGPEILDVYVRAGTGGVDRKKPAARLRAR